jgi:hypothetical protein
MDLSSGTLLNGLSHESGTISLGTRGQFLNKAEASEWPLSNDGHRL